jgi:hypothetical protein
MIAYCFPPVGGIGIAGSQRALKFVKHLQNFQWEPTVLTVKEEFYEPYMSMDYNLLSNLPDDIEIIRTSVIRGLSKVLQIKNRIKSKFINYEKKCKENTHTQKYEEMFIEWGWYKKFKDTITDLFEIPDEEMGWILPGVWAGVRAVKKKQIDIIYSTGRPWTSHVIGMALKVLTGKPLVVEFRDPWMTNPFRKKYSNLKNNIEGYLERVVIKNSDLVIANTYELKEEFIKRFQVISKEKFTEILNGFDSNDYVNNMAWYNKERNKEFLITHTGFLYGKRDPINFIKALKLLIDKKFIEDNSIRIFLIGSIELQYDISEYIEYYGLNNIFIIHDHVSYKKSLEYMQKSDVLLLLQPDTKTQIPSKLFDYLGMRKPILAISPYGGATYNLMSRENMGRVAQPDDIEGIADAIYAMYNEWKKGNCTYKIDNNIYDKFEIKHITKMLSLEFNKVLDV